jgi:SNF2 family DNA or RNA helicase
MNLMELQQIVFKSASTLMKKEGEKIFSDGLVSTIQGKKIEDIYHIYSTVKSQRGTIEFSTHMKINLSTKRLEGVKCSCDDFKALSTKGHSFMCSHLIASAYRFFELISKNKVKENESDKDLNDYRYGGSALSLTSKLVRKVSKDSIYYESQVGSEKVRLQPDELRTFLENIKHQKIKFKYEHLEFTAPIFHRDLPLTFTLKGRGEALVLTTHKQLPISLNFSNDVFLYKNELYLPSRQQIDKYLPFYKRFKVNSEILYKKDIGIYNKLLSLLNSISQNINISEEIRNYMSNLLEPKFYLYEEENNIYCDAKIDYGSNEINLLKNNNGRNSPARDYRKEEKILIDLEKYGFIKRKGRLLFIGGDEELFNILSKKRGSIHSLGTVILGKGLKDRKFYTSASIEAALDERDGYFDFTYGIKSLDYKELNSAIEAYRQNKGFFKTKDNDFVDFEDNGMRDFFNLLQILNIDDSINNGLAQIERNKALYINETIKANRINFIKGAERLKEIEDKLENIGDMKIKTPKNLKGALREYQITGFKWLKVLSSLGFGGILADEMGLGKTIQTIAFILSEEGRRAFIICPTSLIYNWKEEFEKFAPSIKLGIVHGDKSERIKVIDNLTEYDVILTTYGTLRMDEELYENIAFDYCIIDEGQNIKNPLTQNTKVIKQIKAKVRFALTGTPIENNLTELWSILDFIMPGYLYSKEVFEEKFVRKADNLEELKLLIKPFILRRTKKEVMEELPDKIEKKYLVEMRPEQKAVYNTYAEYVRNKMTGSSQGKIEIFSYLTKLRQICLDPSLIIDDYEGGSGKLDIVMGLIQDHIESYGKVLLFSQFTSVLDRIGEYLNEKDIQYYHLYGGTKPTERIKMVNEFNSSEDRRVFLISLKAGGTGLNLTSANLVIHFDPWWNPAVENQATDRAHRIGQRNVVEVIKLVAKGTIEEKIILLQEDKRELIESIISGELENSDLTNKLSKEELLSLFSRE